MRPPAINRQFSFSVKHAVIGVIIEAKKAYSGALGGRNNGGAIA